MRVKSPQDFGAAAVFVLIGVAGLVFGRDLAFGSASNMGPGYFPAILSALILALGIGIGLRALAMEGPPIERVRLRPMAFIIAAVLLFGPRLKAAGLALTALVLTFVAAFARPGAKPLETLLLGVGLAAFVVLVFVYALHQPLPVWWGR
jgi:hypothetical protein